jgi:hypothetical protein
MTEEVPPAAKPSFLKRSVSFGGFCEFITDLALAFTWLGSLGRYHWALDLVSHFRLQYLVAGMVVVPFTFFRRRTWLVLAALISTRMPKMKNGSFGAENVFVSNCARTA